MAFLAIKYKGTGATCPLFYFCYNINNVKIKHQMQTDNVKYEIEVNNKIKAPIKEEEIKKEAEKILQELFPSIKFLSPLSIALVDKNTIRALNKKYRKLNKITNVLTFGAIGEDLMEIVICWDRIKKEADRAKISLKEYFEYVLRHGIENLKLAVET